jgi:nucleotide-binding universal stress UspA family protein
VLAFKVIVVPTDFSDYSLRALAYANGLAEKYGAGIKLVYVNEPALQVSDVAWTGVNERTLKDQHLHEAQRNLQEIVTEQIPSDIPSEAVVLNGEAVDEIIHYANDVRADLIVMATHGRGKISHLLMGSTAEHVIRKASCPVLTLKQPMQVSPKPKNPD